MAALRSGFGIGICQATVVKYLVRRRQPPSQTWRTFLRNHIAQIVAAVFFAARAGLPPELRLFVITGFMGGLTTFSTFSVEVVTLIAQSQVGWALVVAVLHLIGSFVLTGLGMWTARGWLVAT